MKCSQHIISEDTGYQNDLSSGDVNLHTLVKVMSLSYYFSISMLYPLEENHKVQSTIKRRRIEFYLQKGGILKIYEHMLKLPQELINICTEIL